MEHHSATYFSKKGDGPVVVFGKTEDPGSPWQYTIRIGDGKQIGRDIDIHIATESDLIRFKTSVLDAYRQHCLKRGI